MKNRILAAILTVGLAVAAFATSPAQAGTATASSAVGINYVGICTISATNPTFDFTGASDASSTANVTVNCSNSLPWTITADGGLAASGETRRATLNTGHLTYRLYKDAGLTQEVGVTSNTFAAGTGNGGDQVQTAYLAVKTADNPGGHEIGLFTDTLGWDVAF